MTKITQKQSAKIATLIEHHQKLIEAGKVVGKKNWGAGLNLTRDDGSNDYVDLSLDSDIAQSVIDAQLARVLTQLKALGLEMA